MRQKENKKIAKKIARKEQKYSKGVKKISTQNLMSTATIFPVTEHGVISQQ
jgi:hypothetical protein